VSDGQWYLHLFAPEQPDLNWDNPEVHADFLTTLRFWSDRGVDGFRVDVAHGLVKSLADPLADLGRFHGDVTDGSHPFWDRDGVHEIYAEWRRVFNEYDPPRMAVAEAHVHPSRRPRYASPAGLGQAFNFDLLWAGFAADDFRAVIDAQLDEAATTGASSTWVLSNHDVVRHATRYGLPPGPRHAVANAWLNSNGTEPPLDRELGLRRARAAVLLMLALPGSAYLYQGEELGLHEVGDLPAAVLQDPTFRRSGGAIKGRDGCRVPLPWTRTGPSFGFGPGGSHLPQPQWFGAASVEAEESTSDSTLALYRQALTLRRRLHSADQFEWVEPSAPTVLHFRRPSGWHSVTNFGTEPAPMPAGSVLLASGPIDGDHLPPATTAWLWIEPTP
jgi:alpha-glucosidase